MRVLLYGAVDLSLPGGLETHLRELARGLAGRGHEVEVFGRPEHLPGLRMVRDVDPARYDVLHQHGGAWPRRLASHPGYVRTFHFSTAAKMSAYVRLGRWKTLARPGNWLAVAEERAATRRRGRFIAVSERLRRDLTRWHGLDPARVTVIPNGVPPPAAAAGGAAAPTTFAPGVAATSAAARGVSAPAVSAAGIPATGPVAPATPEAGSVRERWGVRADAPVLLTIGRDDFVKGHGLLARAWRRAALPAGATWISVGGRVPARAPGRLVTGPVPHEEVLAWILAADAGALPSYYEGCSVALLEMLAGGLFTLAHDVGNASELIGSGAPPDGCARGEIVAPEPDAWAAALARTLGARPRRPGPGLPAEFGWDSIAARVEEVYRAASGR
jgi:glycosyltransferase involved in cell wall biosynthesis